MSVNAPGPPPPRPEGARTLGVVFPPAGRHYTLMQLDYIGGIAEAANEEGYAVLLTPGTTAGDAWFRGAVSGGRVDGLIVMEIRLHDDRVEYLTERRFPFATIGRTRTPDRTRWVDLDYTALAGNCVRHLLELGHRRIAFVNRSQGLIDTGYESALRGLEGFSSAMADAGLEGRVYSCGDDVESGMACVDRLLADEPGTTGIVTMNEASLRGLYRGLVRAGRTVPRDFSVVAVAAGRWAEQLTPQLTAAAVPAKDIARTAVSLLTERLDAPDSPPRHVLLEPLLSLRGSTAPVR
jgi:DNA-binding LacI/PurR family transcriptional regulator